MKNLVPLLTFLLVSQLVFSQDIRSAREFFSLKFTPTALLNPAKPTFLIGAEFKLTPKFGLHLEHGFQSPGPVKIIGDNDFYYNRMNRQYKRTKIEIRRHTFLGWRASHYQAIGVMNYFEEYVARAGFVRFRDGRNVRHSSAQIFRTEWGGYFLFGSKIWTSDHFYTDIFAGFGGRLISVDYGFVNVLADLGPSEVPKRSLFDVGDLGHRYERSIGQFLVDFGIKLGYAF